MIKEKLSVIIPAYNEEKRIGKTLDSYLEFFHDTEIFVTMDGCKDKTLDIVKRYSENENKNGNLVSYIHSDKRLGKGMGILRSVDHTKGDIIAITDADSSTSPSEIFKLVKLLDEYDCVIGSRWLPGSKISKKQSMQRIIASRGFNFLVRCMFRLPFKDTQCGAKVFRKEAIRSVAKEMTTFNFAFDIDLLWQLERNGYKIKEVPIVWNDDKRSSVKLFRDIIMMFLAIVRLRIVNSPLGPTIKNDVVYEGGQNENINFQLEGYNPSLGRRSRSIYTRDRKKIGRKRA